MWNITAVQNIQRDIFLYSNIQSSICLFFYLFTVIHTYIFYCIFIDSIFVNNLKNVRSFHLLRGPKICEKIVLRDLYKDNRSTRYIGSFEFYVHFLKAEGANPPSIPSLILAEDHWLILRVTFETRERDRIREIDIHYLGKSLK